MPAYGPVGGCDMARGYVFGSRAAADSARTTIDTAEGYPKAGVDVGGGRHVSPTFVTQTHCQPVKHPTLNEWAVLQDSRVTAAIDGRPGIPAATDLDAGWGLSAAAAQER